MNETTPSALRQENKKSVINLPQKLHTTIVFITFFLDGVGVTFISFVYLLFMTLADPANLDVEAKVANIHQGQQVLLVGIFIFFIYFFSAFLWRKEKRFWKSIYSGLLIISLLIIGIPAIMAVLFSFTTNFLTAFAIIIFTIFFWWLNIFSIRFISSKPVD
jgi:small-conductance mechanosensitive channel